MKIHVYLQREQVKEFKPNHLTPSSLWIRILLKRTEDFCYSCPQLVCCVLNTVAVKPGCRTLFI